MEEFRFRQFTVRNGLSALKVGTDAVVLGSTMTLNPADCTALDIGTGTGVIALMVAQRLAACRIEAVDIDPAAASEASLNFAGSPWPERLKAVCADLRAFSPSGPYDLVFSNPPYFEASLVNPDARKAAARHTSGLSYRDILAFSAERLTPCGRLSLILPAETEPGLIRTAASFGLHPFRLLRIRTIERKPVRRIVAEFSRTRESAIREESLILQDGPLRTREYSELTKEFYL